jgi:sugar phosphate isomerase/epimerase
MGRAMMGDGVIDLHALRQAVEANGCHGPIEVEIFNDELWKNADSGLSPLIRQRFAQHV